MEVILRPPNFFLAQNALSINSGGGTSPVGAQAALEGGVSGGCADPIFIMPEGLPVFFSQLFDRDGQVQFLRWMTSFLHRSRWLAFPRQISAAPDSSDTRQVIGRDVEEGAGNVSVHGALQPGRQFIERPGR